MGVNTRVVCDHAGELEVGIGDRAGRVSGRNQRRLDVGGEAGTPQKTVRWAIGGTEEVHTAHAMDAGVRGADNIHGPRIRFANGRRAGRQVAMKPPDIVQEVVKGRAEMDARLGRVKSRLEKTKHATKTRDGKCHTAQFAEDTVPFLGGNSALCAGEVVQNGLEAVEATGQQRQGVTDGVDDPPEDFFGGVPGGVAAAQFLDGDGFLPSMRIRQGKRPEDLINGVEERAT